MAEGQTIFIQLSEGEISVHGGENGQVRVGGQARFPDRTQYTVATVKDQIQIISDYTRSRLADPAIHLNVSIPSHVKLKIETDSASITVSNYEGEVEAASVSGDILITGVNGQVVVRSNRGDVKVQDSTGRTSAVGNYGLLTVENTHGDIGVSTIMGTITFNGLIHTGDDVRLETDHGPVVVNLNTDSSLHLQAKSTSGDVACMLPNISTSLRTCDGTLHSGEGSLAIRTVSGAVTLQRMP